MPSLDQNTLIKAFLKFESNVKSNYDSETGSDLDTIAAGKGYMESIRGFIMETDLDCLVPVYEHLSNKDILATSEKFLLYMLRFTAQLNARILWLDEAHNDDSDGQELLRISSSYKVEIHDRLNQIRKIVSVADLTIDKRDLIYDKISALGQEVDRERTRLGTVMSNILDISNAAGQAVKNAEPLNKKVNSLIQIFSGAKAESEQLLIETDEVKSLPAPDEE